MGGPFPEYLALLRELCGHLDRLAVLAQEKADAARQDDLLALDEVLKQEQAMTLTLRGLEQRRQKLSAELELTDTKLSGLPAKCPPELQDEARDTVEALRQGYQVYRSCSDMARNTLELALHQIDKFVAAAGVDPAEAGAGYEPPGAEPPKNMKTDFRA